MSRFVAFHITLVVIVRKGIQTYRIVQLRKSTDHAIKSNVTVLSCIAGLLILFNQKSRYINKCIRTLLTSAKLNTIFGMIIELFVVYEASSITKQKQHNNRKCLIFTVGIFFQCPEMKEVMLVSNILKDF